MNKISRAVKRLKAAFSKNTRKKKNLHVFIKYKNGVCFEEGLRRAGGHNLTIASNHDVDEWLNSEKRNTSACWTGTFVAYEKPGKAFEESVVYTNPSTNQRYVFPVPKEYRGLKNAILILEHPGFTLETDGKDRIVVPSKTRSLGVLEHFPEKEGRYLKDEKYALPVGRKAERSNQDSRYLWRCDSRIGSVLRNSSVPRGVDLDIRAGRYGILTTTRPKNRNPKTTLPAEAAGMSAGKTSDPGRNPESRQVVTTSPEQLDSFLKAAENCLKELSGTVSSDKLEPLKEFLEFLKKEKTESR